jgi:hypothetical protein
VLLHAAAAVTAALPAATVLPGMPMKPGSQVMLKSIKTGKYCRVVRVDRREQIKCDVANPADATPMVYTGTGFSYQARPAAQPQLLTAVAASHSCMQQCDLTHLRRLPAGPAIYKPRQLSAAVLGRSWYPHQHLTK